jgi:dolichyl-phosphate-mannose--protein O-mannosyl transferase
MTATTTTTQKLWSKHAWYFLGFVILLSYLTYFHNYWNPPAVFWDENYHIASAQKYLNHVYFMEQHPPLGKLLIAFGEKILNRNPVDNQFIGTDYATNFPPGFSFAGYRFFSALMGWLTAPILFFIFLFITRNALYATFLSFFYIFDNGVIVHTRGAMLEGPLMFFSASMILTFFLLREYSDSRRLFPFLSILFGAIFACILTTKLLGLLFILLLPALLLLQWPEWRKMLLTTFYFLLGFIVLYVTVWQIHFALGDKMVSSLPDQGFYQASEEYKHILALKKNDSLLSFPVMIRDSIKFVGHYNRGTPRLDLCKPDENGSPWYFWPFGARSINYRWETPDGKSYRYLYLQSNPLVWWTAFAAVLLGLAFLVSSVLLPLKQKLKRPYLLLVFIGMYISFFIAISRIERVMYLYHYFTALLLAFIILALVFDELSVVGRRVITEYWKTVGLMVLAGCIFASYQFYRPFSYYEPLTAEQFQRRNIFSLWELTCVNCQKESGLVIPRTCQ